MSRFPPPAQLSPSALNRERTVLLRRLEHLLEVPMLVLRFVWLGLLIVELTRGLSPALEIASTVI